MIVSKNNFDAPNLIPVPVIASFSPDGKVRPLYLKWDGESVKILGCKIRREHEWAILFECVYEQYGLEKNIILYFNLRDHAWFIQTGLSM